MGHVTHVNASCHACKRVMSHVCMNEITHGRESYRRYIEEPADITTWACCSVLQCVVVYCSMLQCVAVSCSVLQCVAVCCSVLQCVAEK